MPDPEELPEFDSSEEFEGIDIDIQSDGTVHLHAACRPGEDPAACRQRMQFLVDALGIPIEGVVTNVEGEES